MKNFRVDELSFEQLNMLDEYLCDGEWKPLANNIAKLNRGGRDRRHREIFVQKLWEKRNSCSTFKPPDSNIYVRRSMTA